MAPQPENVQHGTSTLFYVLKASLCGYFRTRVSIHIGTYSYLIFNTNMVMKLITCYGAGVTVKI